MCACPVESRGVLRETRPEAIVEGQHVVALCELPPELDHRGEALRLHRREVVCLVEVLVELVELPFVRVERRARRMVGNGLPALVPQPAVPKLLKVLRVGLRWRLQVSEARLEAHTLERQLPDT